MVTIGEQTKKFFKAAKWVNRKTGALVKIEKINDQTGKVLYRRLPEGAIHQTKLDTVMKSFILAGV